MSAHCNRHYNGHYITVETVRRIKRKLRLSLLPELDAPVWKLTSQYKLFIYWFIWCCFPGDHSYVFQSVHQRQSGNEQVSRSSYSGLCYSGRYITLIFAYSLNSKICLSYWFVLLSWNLDVGSNVELKKWIPIRIKNYDQMSKKEVIKKWRLNKDSIVFYRLFKRFCRKSNFPFPIFFCHQFSSQEKQSKVLKN